MDPFIGCVIPPADHPGFVFTHISNIYPDLYITFQHLDPAAAFFADFVGDWPGQAGIPFTWTAV